MLLLLLLPPFRRVEVLAVIVVDSREPAPVLVVLLPLLPVSMRQGVGGDSRRVVAVHPRPTLGSKVVVVVVIGDLS